MCEYIIFADERIEGLDNIRKVIDPQMSRRTFFRKWRPRINHILMLNDGWWRRNPPYKYFVFRRFLYAVMLQHCDPRRQKKIIDNIDGHVKSLKSCPSRAGGNL